MEFPRFQELCDKLGNQGIGVLTINVYDPVARIRQYLADNRLAFAVGRDPKSEVAELYNVHEAPTTIVLDPQGRVVFACNFMDEETIWQVVRDLGVGRLP